MTRGRRAILNFVSGTALTAVTMVVGLVSVPYIVRWLGDEQYGAFRTTVDWFGYLSLLELGLAGALMPLLARALSQGDQDAVGRTMAAGIRGYTRVTVFMLVVALGLVAVITKLVPVSDANASDLTRAAFFAALGGSHQLLRGWISALCPKIRAAHPGLWGGPSRPTSKS